MTPPPLMPPPYCLGCPHPIYDDRRGKGYPRIEREEPPSLQGVTIDLYGPPRYARSTTDGRTS